MPRALWVTAAGEVALLDAPLPPRADGQLRLRMLASGISRGTERLVLHHRVPESQYAVMRAPLQLGDFGGPVAYGYCGVAMVEEGALSGRRVFVLAPHQEALVAPAHFCTPLPDALPTHRAVLGANMETALNIMWDARPLAGERALVIGAGVVGLLAAFLLARFPGVQVTVVDPDASRAAIARALGADFRAPAEAPADQELIIHASATEAGLNLALSRAGFEARLIEASWFGAARPALPLGEAFHQKRLQIISTQVGSVSPAMRGRRTHGERMALALDLLRDDRLDGLLEPPIAFADLPRHYAALLERPALCPLVTYPETTA
ncbi:zinc-binding alcohol dehydrogenase [Rhodovarius crocodyli]|uniref:Zinc-binding alcohol dehydrogenase n=1 Tax=Rhodovarius crocodyli TaxID=1979269 RepID=A0A437MNI3_9PROT|nr:zinc-binding alcohol dehydrogenase [Rhodovarius crocodyli]RVT99211.1 zinc-binding alcohol dehydrogenase [Rhodovarius crocodyli]